MSTALVVRHGVFGRAALYRLNRPFLTHAHREAHLTFHVRGASPRIKVENTQVVLAADTGVAVSPWQPHSYDPIDCDEETVALVFYIHPQWTAAEGLSSSGGLRFGRAPLAVVGRLRSLVQRTIAILVGEDVSNDFERHLLDLVRTCHEQSFQAAETAGAWERQQLYRDYRIRNSLRLMNDRIGDECAIDLIARDAGLSRPHFYKLFRQHVGVTPNIYLNTLRMESAIERLTRTKDAVTSIGLDLGFASQASFTRFFATNVGVPPSDYRRAAALPH